MTPASASASSIAWASAPGSGWVRVESRRAGIPAAAARSSTCAPGLLETISTTSPSIRPLAQASITAWAVVPVPEAKMASAIATGASIAERAARDRAGVAG